jgi:probable HAF family extracellular repeat protein
MFSISRTSFSAPCALALLALSCVAQAQAQKSYRLTFIASTTPTEVGDSLRVVDLNNKGQVVGTLNTEDLTSTQAFIWSNGELEIIPNPFPGGGETSAFGLNDRSDVVLRAQGQDGPHILLWHRGAFDELDSNNEPELRVTSAMDVNNRREVLADATNEQFEHFAVVWHQHRLTRVQQPATGERAIPFVINNRGDLGGLITGEIFVPAVWHSNVPTPLPLPAGASSGSVAALNDHGVAAGAFGIAGTFDQEAAVWNRTQVTRLPPLASRVSSDAFSINDHRIVAGISFSDFIMRQDRIATIWRGATPVDLNTVIAADDPLRPFVELQSARSINDRGQILVEGHDSRSRPDIQSFYLLTPEP